MRTNRFFARMDSFLETWRSTVEVAGAVERREKPAAHHLRRMGIDPKAFDGIGRL